MTSRLDPARAALLVVDMQDSIFRHCIDRDRVERSAVKLIRACRELGLPILVTEQYPDGLGPTTEAVAAALGPHPAVPKTCFSGLGEARIERLIEESGRRQVILCGIEAHICIYQTGRDLLASDREVHLAADAVASRTPLDRRVGIRRLQDEGAVLTTSEMAIYDLLGDAGTAAFRRLLPILRDR